jgi:DNA polymerase-3 subunit beta
MLSDAADSTEAMVGFEAGGRRLTTRLLAGEFIKYRSRFPAKFSCVADLPAEAFTEAVRRVSLVAERGTPVQLSFSPGQVTMMAATQGQARARETVPVEFSGDEPAIAFSPHYLLDGVVAAAATAGTGTEDAADAAPVRVRLQFSSPGKPAVITPCPAGEGQALEGNFRYLVAPQQVSQLARRPGRAQSREAA